MLTLAELQEKASDSDDFEDDNEDDIDLSEEDDNDYFDNRRRRMPRKVGQSLKQKDTKPSVNIRRKRGRTFSDEEYHSSGNDLEEDSEEDLSRKARSSSQSRKRGGGNSTMTANTNLISSELRTSGRLVKKVSYAESEESEDIDEEKSNKFQKVWISMEFYLLIFVIVGSCFVAIIGVTLRVLLHH